MQTTTISLTDHGAYLTDGETTWELPPKLPAGGLGQACARARRGTQPVKGAERTTLPDDAVEALRVVGENIIITGPIRPSLERVCHFAGWATRTVLATRGDVEQLVTVNQVAERTGVAYNRAYHWMTSRTAPEPVDPESKRPQWRWSDVRAFLLGPDAPASKLIDRWKAEDRAAELEAAVDG